MTRAATFLALLLLVPTAAAATEHPVVARERVWIAAAEATRARVTSEHTDLPSEFDAAWRILSQPNATENVVGLAAAYAYFQAVVGYVEARAEVPVDYRTDGRNGCVANSSCGRLLARADAAVASAEAAHASALERARDAWADLERARGLEAAVVAQAAFDDAQGSMAGYPTARGRVTALRSYDPSSPAYEHLLVAAWAAAHVPGRLLPLAEDLVAAAQEADRDGPRLDPGRLRDAMSGLAPRDANATAPEAAASYLARRAAAEHDRLVFTAGDGDAAGRIRVALAEEIALAAPALAHARGIGLDGLVLADALAGARAASGDASASEGTLARATGDLIAARALHARLLDPAVVAEAPAAHGRSGVVVAAVATAGALALVGGAALLLRRKP